MLLWLWLLKCPTDSNEEVRALGSTPLHCVSQLSIACVFEEGDPSVGQSLAEAHDVPQVSQFPDTPVTEPLQHSAAVLSKVMSHEP